MANYLKGLGELGLQAVTGAVAQPASGIGAILGKTQGRDFTKEEIEAAQESMTYSPRSQEAKNIAEGAGDFAQWAWDKVPNPIQEGIKAIPQKYQQATDYVGEQSPLLGAAMAAAPAGVATMVPYGSRVSKMNFESIPSRGMGNEEGIFRYHMGHVNKVDPSEVEYQKAQDLYIKGTDPKEIWQRTGWYFDPRVGEWMSEIDDSMQRWTSMNDATSTGYQVSDYVKHPELSKLFPDFEKIPTVDPDSEGLTGGLGMHDSGINGLSVRGNLDNSYSIHPNQIVNHELGHYVQDQMSMPRGGTPSEFYPKGLESYDALNQKLMDKSMSNLFNKFPSLLSRGKDDLKDLLHTPSIQVRKNPGYQNILNDPDYQDWLTLVKERIHKITPEYDKGYKSYMDLHGEALARLSEGRKDLSAFERRAQYPFDEFYFYNTTGSNLDDLIIK